jgi:nitroimidazol reductase NimA-like FMN-containing flavoprotein (pyridoxamine 5'-phosphate oxidase superfamily)
MGGASRLRPRLFLTQDGLPGFNVPMPAKKAPTKPPKPKSKAVKSDSKLPKPGRPLMPAVYKIPQSTEGCVPWEWARERLTNSHNYLLTSVRPDARPHSMIVWGIWLDDAYYFSTGATTRKAKNLASNPNCVVCNENIEEAVIVEGQARQLADAEIPEQAFALYEKKYGWKLDPNMGPVIKITPRVVFAMPEKLFPVGATRWVFD